MDDTISHRFDDNRLDETEGEAGKGGAEETRCCE
jgi:hypothetical protein